MYEYEQTNWGNLGRKAVIRLIAFGLLTFYLMFSAAFAVVLQPRFAFIFVAPVFPFILWAAPQMREIPRIITRRIFYLGMFLMPLWPVYLHIKLGPSPILTPTRLVFYVLTAIWIYEMSCVPWRRKQFVVAARRLKPVFWVITGLFILKFMAMPMAEGRSIAIKEGIRHIVIWLLPFFIAVTYISRREYLDRVIGLVIWASCVVGFIALGEFATQTNLAEVLSPLIGHAPWLDAIFEAKIRDGAFRSQATHTHPLSLGEHLAMVIPFAMYKFYRGGQSFIGGAIRTRLLYAFVIILLVGAALMANSRGALIGGVLAFSVTAAMMGFAWSRSETAFAYRPLIGLIIIFSLIVSPIISGAAWQLTKGEEGSTAERSSQARIDQFNLAWPKYLERPILGYGNGRSVSILGYFGENLTIDNYYINLALDLGTMGPILFLLGFINIGVIGYRWGRRLLDDPYSGLYFAYTGMVI